MNHHKTLALGLCLPWLGLMVLPLALLQIQAFPQIATVWSAEHTPRLLSILCTSLAHAAIAATLATALSFPAAQHITRTRLNARDILQASLCLPLLIPLIVHTFAWMLAFGTQGWLSPIIGGGDLMRHPSIAIILIWTSALFPISFILQCLAMNRTHRAGEDAAQLIPLTLPHRLRIRWGYIALPAAASWLVLFMLLFYNSSVPSYFGKHFYASEMMSEFSLLAHPAQAAALATPVLLFCLLLLLLLRQLANRAYTASAHRTIDPPTQAPSMTGIALLSVLLVFSLGLPLLTMLRESHWLTQIASDARLHSDEIKNSIISTLLTTAFAIPIALSLYAARTLLHRHPVLARSLDVIVTFPAALPHSLLALAFILFWSQPGWRHALYNSSFMHPLGLALILSPILYWCLRLSSITTPNRYHEAADLSGLPFLRRFWLLDIRSSWQWLGAGITLLMCAALSNLEATQMISRPGGTTLSATISQMLHYGRDATMASLCLILVLMIVVIALPLGLLLRWHRKQALHS